MMEDIQFKVGNIGNYYGVLSVRMLNGVPSWSIENYDGHDWEEIPMSLFKELAKFEGLEVYDRP